MSNYLLLSIRPKYVDEIFKGVKRVELRRVKPKLDTGGIIIVYATAPVSAIVGVVYVDRVIECDPEGLWSDVKHDACLTREEYEDYYMGAEKGVGIFIKSESRLDVPIDLATLRSIWTRFHPPQSYRYLSAAELDELALSHLLTQTAAVIDRFAIAEALA